MPVTRVMLEYVHPWPNHAGLFLARRNGGFAHAANTMSPPCAWDTFYSRGPLACLSSPSQRSISVSWER